MNEKEFDKYVMNTYKRIPVFFEYGDGVYIYDKEGKKYLDFVSGIAVNILGYNNKNFIKTITGQLNKINHSSNLFYVEPQGILAKKLAEISGLNKTFFCNSGAEANEAAIKLARKYALINNKGNKIIAMKNSFHSLNRFTSPRNFITAVIIAITVVMNMIISLVLIAVFCLAIKLFLIDTFDNTSGSYKLNA